MSKRKINVKSKAEAKPEVKAKVSKPEKSAEKRLYRSVARDVAGIERNATHFGAITPRDDNFLAFFASFGKKTLTVAELAEKVYNPYWVIPGREKEPPHKKHPKSSDIGVINRGGKSGRLVVASDKKSFTFTPEAYSQGTALLKKIKAGVAA